MDEDSFYFMIEPDDRPFVDIIFKAGRYNNGSAMSRELIEDLIRAEGVGLDPETIIAEIKKKLVKKLHMYDSLSNTISERLSNEF